MYECRGEFYLDLTGYLEVVADIHLQLEVVLIFYVRVTGLHVHSITVTVVAVVNL